MRKRSLAGTSWIATSALVAPASAQAPAGLEPGAPALAQQRYLVARDLYGKGRLQEAQAELEVAYELFPTSPKLAYNLARVHERLGHTPDALRFYRRYLELSPGASDAAEVTALVRVLERHLAETPVALSVRSTPAGATVSVDGTTEKPQPAPATLSLAPGRYVVRLHLDGYDEATRTVELAADHSTELDVVLQAARPAPVGPAGVAQRAAPQVPGAAKWRATAGWIGVGVGAAALGTGALFHLQALDTEDRGRALGPGRPDAASRLQQDLDRQQTAMWVGYGVGVALVGAGLYLLLNNDDSRGPGTPGGAAGPFSVTW
jgi:tetratricopeptide (TPR) repeat protein